MTLIAISGHEYGLFCKKSIIVPAQRGAGAA